MTHSSPWILGLALLVGCPNAHSVGDDAAADGSADVSSDGAADVDDGSSDSSPSDAADAPNHDAGDGGVDGSADAEPVPFTEICGMDAEWDLSVVAEGLVDFEHRTLWVFAVETDDASHSEIRVAWRGTVTDGHASMHCEDSLATNFNYPYVAVILDADGSGDCSDDDRVENALMFGWGSDVELNIDASGVEFGMLVSETTLFSGRPVCSLFS